MHEYTTHTQERSILCREEEDTGEKLGDKAQLSVSIPDVNNHVFYLTLPILPLIRIYSMESSRTVFNSKRSTTTICDI